MIDEQLLLEKLTDAAAAQDELLPRAVADDLAAGRRRLRLRRFLTAGTALIAAGAVAVVTIGATGMLKEAEPPIATPPSKPVVKPQPNFDQLMKSLMYKHFDPAKKHLNFETGPFDVVAQPGHRGAQNKVGWNTAGDKGQGMFLIALDPSARAAGRTCGTYSALKCRPVKVPGGGQAILGRDGRKAELTYQQPDGEFVYLLIDPVFGNNTTIPSRDMRITDAQLIAFATDPALNLPPLTPAQQADEDKLKNFAPSVADIQRITARHIPGAFVFGDVEDAPGELLVRGTWTRGAQATVEVGLDVAPLASECAEQLSVPSCSAVTLSTGQHVGYHEGARTYQGGPSFVRGATYKQPDGDLVSVRVLFPGNQAPAGAITRHQIFALVTDPALDR